MLLYTGDEVVKAKDGAGSATLSMVIICYLLCIICICFDMSTTMQWYDRYAKYHILYVT